MGRLRVAAILLLAALSLPSSLSQRTHADLFLKEFLQQARTRSGEEEGAGGGNSNVGRGPRAPPADSEGIVTGFFDRDGTVKPRNPTMVRRMNNNSKRGPKLLRSTTNSSSSKGNIVSIFASPYQGAKSVYQTKSGKNMKTCRKKGCRMNKQKNSKSNSKKSSKGFMGKGKGRVTKKPSPAPTKAPSTAKGGNSHCRGHTTSQLT